MPNDPEVLATTEENIAAPMAAMPGETDDLAEDDAADLPHTDADEAEADADEAEEAEDDADDEDEDDLDDEDDEDEDEDASEEETV